MYVPGVSLGNNPVFVDAGTARAAGAAIVAKRIAREAEKIIVVRCESCERCERLLVVRIGNRGQPFYTREATVRHRMNEGIICVKCGAE